MKAKSKALLLTVCAVLLIAASALGTTAYLTVKKSVTNTFTIGKVDITLDETKTDAYGAAVTPAAKTTTGNAYKLIPGHSYTKDPAVTVAQGSEPAYIKMTVTVNKFSAMSTAFGTETNGWLKIFTGLSSDWTLKGYTDNSTANTRCYEFRYKTGVDARTAAQTLPALFSGFTIPGTTTGSQLAAITGLTINVDAYAIQSEGFANADAAWAAWPAE